MIEAREDVERLFRIDRLPPQANAVYDTEDYRRAVVMPLRLEPPWNTALFLIEELRAEVVRLVTGIKTKGARELRPFTLVRAHEAMACWDVMLDSFLIHPDFAPLCGNIVKPFFGKVAKLFAHPEVPYAEIYGLAEPDYVGVIPVQNGQPGALMHARNVVWGRFSALAGV